MGAAPQVRGGCYLRIGCGVASLLTGAPFHLRTLRVPAAGGTGVCSCFGSFSGPSCAECPKGHYGPTCAACPYSCVHGTCNGTGTITGNGACVCSSNEWGGTLCNTCEPPYTTASDDDGGGCSCNPPYSGTHCEGCEYNKWGPTCSTSVSAAWPRCNACGARVRSWGAAAPHASWHAVHLCQCETCEHGGTFVGCQSQATGAHCECPAAYAGTTCSTCSSIAVSSSGNECYVCPLDNSGTVCGDHGTCVAPSWPSTTASCSCTYPWYVAAPPIVAPSTRPCMACSCFHTS